MIFISYSSKDAKLAGGIKDELEAAGYSCFLAHDDIGAMADWHEQIWTALRGSNAFIGLVTEDFYASSFCQQEVGAAFALSKPSLLVRVGTKPPPGFAARWQATPRAKLLEVLNAVEAFRPLRAEAWIEAVQKAGSFQKANEIHGRFHGEWAKMTDDEKLRWLLAAATNGQVSGESFKAGRFYDRVKKELKPLLTDQWLFDHDKSGVLHDFTSNPIAKK